MLFRRNNHEEEHNFWMSYTDLMSGFLVVFIIISLVTNVKYSGKNLQYDTLKDSLDVATGKIHRLDSLIDEYQKNDLRIDSLLANYQKNDLRNLIEDYKQTIGSTEAIRVQFDTIRGSIILTHKYGEIFATGEPKVGTYNVPYDLKCFLDANGKAIVEKTRDISQQYNRPVELRIEGHTDPTWKNLPRGSDNSFMENLKLSSRRAEVVYQYILNETLLDENKEIERELKKFAEMNMISVGYSFSSRIIDNSVDNTYKDDESRRIEFRIIAK